MPSGSIVSAAASSLGDGDNFARGYAKGDSLTAEKLNEGVGAVNSARRDIDVLKSQVNQRSDFPNVQILPLVISGIIAATGELQAKRTKPETFNSGVTAPLTIDDIGTQESQSDSIIWDAAMFPGVVLSRFYGTNTDGKAVHIGFARERVPVTLDQTGGSDGDGSSSPTWEYTATNDTGQVLATGLQPQMNRPTGKTMPATRGWLKYTDGEWEIWDCDEAPNFGTDCSTP